MRVASFADIRETGGCVISFRYCSLYYIEECVLLQATNKIPGS